LLSIDEVNRYFPSNEARIANYEGIAAFWWLRSPGSGNHVAAYVDYWGDVDIGGCFVSVTDDGNYMSGAFSGVRPALLIQT
jgi:hypothetical protein